jgi:putative hydrolase
MGSKRIRAVRESLAGRHRLGHHTRTQYYLDRPISQISLQELLEIDAQYRRLAEVGKLPRIAPRRFNPTGDAWLPILHTEREDRHYTALYSNTARAHEFGMTHDWVVIYRDDDVDHSRWTVITARFGALRGKRVVRGREEECVEYYRRVSDDPRQQATLFEL